MITMVPVDMTLEFFVFASFAPLILALILERQRQRQRQALKV
jgi:hypothetical protein